MLFDWLIAGLEKSQRECWQAPHVYSLLFIFPFALGLLVFVLLDPACCIIHLTSSGHLWLTKLGFCEHKTCA